MKTYLKNEKVQQVYNCLTFEYLHLKHEFTKKWTNSEKGAKDPCYRTKTTYLRESNKKNFPFPVGRAECKFLYRKSESDIMIFF